jgi:hypothetical protein
MMGSEDNKSVRVADSAGCRKHEKKTVDCRAYISMYRTGSITGDTGKTVFLIKGKHRQIGYTDAFLQKFG